MTSTVGFLRVMRRLCIDAVRDERELRRSATRLELGRASYAFKRPRIVVYDGDPAHRVTAGAFCSIAEDVTFVVGGGHRTDWISTYPFDAAFQRGHPASRGPIVVGNDVWIGMGATVLSGVTIGDGAVIGARAVVARDVPPYAVVVGSPAREIRRRFSAEDVDTLLRIRWWEWPPVAIEQAEGLLTAGNIASLERFAVDQGLAGRGARP